MARLRRGQFSAASPAQIEQLSSGMALCGGDPGDDAALKRAWEQSRESIMAEKRPGFRPWGYFRFDLGIEQPPHSWPDQLRALLDAGVLDGDEQAAIERAGTFQWLNPDQSETFGGWFEDAKHLKQSGAYGLREILREFEFAAEWHERRGRPHLAERYTRRAEAVKEFIKGGF